MKEAEIEDVRPFSDLKRRKVNKSKERKLNPDLELEVYTSNLPD